VPWWGWLLAALVIIPLWTISATLTNFYSWWVRRWQDMPEDLRILRDLAEDAEARRPKPPVDFFADEAERKKREG
jgi:hypothetical protein